MKKQIKLLSMAVLLASSAYCAGLDQDERCAQMIRAAKEEATRTAAKTKEEREAELRAKVAAFKAPITAIDSEFATLSRARERGIVYKQVLFSIDDRTAELDAENALLGGHIKQLGGEITELTAQHTQVMAAKDDALSALAKENAEKDARIAELLAQLEVQTKVNEANARSQLLIERLIFASKDGRSRVPTAAPIRRNAAALETSATPSLDVVQEASK